MNYVIAVHSERVEESGEEIVMSFGVYILECADGSYYTGHTDNIEKRLAEHNQKAFKCYTSSRLPVKLAFCNEFQTRDEAFASERQIKGWTRYKKQALIEQDWDKLTNYSKTVRSNPFPINRDRIHIRDEYIN